MSNCCNCDCNNVNCVLTTEQCCAITSSNATASCTNPFATIADLSVHPAVTSTCPQISVDPTTQALTCNFPDWMCAERSTTDALADPADTTCQTIHVNESTGCFQIWNVATQAWGSVFCPECCVTWSATTSDPNGDGITPQNVNAAEILYSPNGTWRWNITTGQWDEIKVCPCSVPVKGPFEVNGQTQDCGELWTYNTLGGNITETVPSAATVGNGCQIGYKIVAGTNSLILATGGETIDNVATYTLDASQESVWIVSDGTNWNIKYNYNPDTNCPCPVDVQGPYVASGQTPKCGDLHVYDVTAGNITEILPAFASVHPCQIGYKATGGITNDLILDGSGGELINGVATYTLEGNQQTVWLVTNGTNGWDIKYDHRPIDTDCFNMYRQNGPNGGSYVEERGFWSATPVSVTAANWVPDTTGIAELVWEQIIPDTNFTMDNPTCRNMIYDLRLAIHGELRMLDEIGLEFAAEYSIDGGAFFSPLSHEKFQNGFGVGVLTTHDSWSGFVANITVLPGGRTILFRGRARWTGNGAAVVGPLDVILVPQIQATAIGGFPG